MSVEFTDGGTPPTEPKSDDGGTPTVTDYLVELVGEGKKYATLEVAVEALAKKAVHADKHIETLLSEKQVVEEKFQTAVTQNKSIEDVLAAINASTVEPKPETSVSETPLTLETILAAVDKDQMGKADTTKRQKLINATWDMLASEKAFGTTEAAQVAVAKYIDKNSDRQAAVNAMAIADPDGLFALVKSGGESVQFTENYEGVHIEGVPNGKLTLAIIKEIREKHPEIYKSKVFQNRIHREL